MALLVDLFNNAFAAHPAAPAADASVVVAGLTMGQLRSAALGAPALVSALGHLIEGHATLGDKEVIADDVIAAALAMAGPEAAPFAALAPMIANLFLAGIDAGTITPGVGANQDALGPHHGRS